MFCLAFCSHPVENRSFNQEITCSWWDLLKQSHPVLTALLSAGTNQTKARERFEDLLENEPHKAAGFLNIVTAMSEIQLRVGSPLDYLKELAWESLDQDRFFAWADAELVAEVERAAASGVFTPEIGSAIFHPGATKSFKQVQFGDANVQLTFHESGSKIIGGIKCVKVESDIDYHKDLVAHTLLEVIPNSFSGRLTDPRTVYVLRWIAGRHAGVPEFNPPYVIV